MEFSYKTKVRVDKDQLAKVVEELRLNYDKVGNRDSEEGRSMFCSWNNIAKFQERLQRIDPKDFIESVDCGKTSVIEIEGSAKGNTARVYYKPSITSLAKPFRSCIVPLNEGSSFMFFDLAAAEFFLFCLFAQEREALDAYKAGEDIYMKYSHLFPEGASRDIIKKSLIANMYETTAYTVAKDLGISEGKAQYLLDNIARKTPRMTAMKEFIVMNARRKKAYFTPQGLDQTKLVKVSDVELPKNPAKLDFGQDLSGFKYRLALSSYVQSALGMWMQALLLDLQKRTSGTLIQVFDSILLEVKDDRLEAAERFLRKRIAPFRTDAIKVAKDFYSAQVGSPLELGR